MSRLSKKGGQLGKAKIAHVKVRVALVQQVADLPNDDPVILVRVLPNDGPQGPADGAQAGAGLLNLLLLLALGLGLLLLFRLGLLLGLFRRGRLLLGAFFWGPLFLAGSGWGRGLLRLLLVGGGEDVQVFELVAGRDKGVRVLLSPMPITVMPDSRSRAASRVKSLSEDTRQKPSTLPE